VEDITQRMQQLVLKLQSLGYSLISDAANPNRFQFEGIEIVLLSNKYNDVVHPVLYVWFQPWLDFSTPPSAFHPALKTIAEHAGEYLTNYNTLSGNNKSRPKKKVAISCLSGRGRSGSVAALIASQLMRKDTSNKFVSSINSGENGWTHATLVHLIVQLRGQRDGMVETPAQYRLLAKLSGLSDPGYEISQIGQQWPVMSYLHFQLQSRKELWLVIGISICIGIGIGAAITVSLN
jgi:protein tyrosine phosphatase